MKRLFLLPLAISLLGTSYTFSIDSANQEKAESAEIESSTNKEEKNVREESSALSS